MKGGAGGVGEKQGRGRALPRLESQRFRLLSIVVGCFVFSVVFLLSSRPDATAFDTSRMSPKPALEDARKPVAAVKTLRSSGSFGRDFHVDVVPQRGQSRGHLEQSGDKAGTEWVRDTVIVEERRSDVEREAELDDREHNAAAVTSNSDDQPARGVTEEEEEVQGNAVQTTGAAAAITTGQPAVETSPGKPEEEDEEEIRQVVGGQQVVNKFQEEEQTPARQEAKPTGSPRPPLCDFSDHRSDVCDFAGDIRLDANTSSFIVVDDSASGSAAGQWHRVRPYPRKGDETCMGRITEITVRTAPSAPRCTVTHTSPAVAFATGGYTGNIFHDFSDVLVPLFNTVDRYQGDVQLVMANVASWWLVKYAKLLRQLSRHAPLDLAKAGAAGEVHCFTRAAVGLQAHRELIIERDRTSPDHPLATPDFTRFIRRALALPRDAPTALGGENRKPRLLIISRHRTRLLLNLAEVVRAAEEVGFEAVVNESDVGNDISQVGQVINSCDAMVGVHGAGLTNMMFLPPGATLVQIVPWGGLQWMARADYGDPAEAMGLKYIQYEVIVEESTLKDKYPRDHQIFTNPTGLHKKGFGFIRQTLMDGQDITVDVARFREQVLLKVLNNLTQ